MTIKERIAAYWRAHQRGNVAAIAAGRFWRAIAAEQHREQFRYEMAQFITEINRDFIRENLFSPYDAQTEINRIRIARINP